MNRWKYTLFPCLLSLFPAVAGAIVFNLAGEPNLSVDSKVEYHADTLTFTGSYLGVGKVARIEWELATSPITSAIMDMHAPKQNWSVTDNSPVNIIYSAPNDPDEYEIYFYDTNSVPIEPLGLPNDTYVSYTFDSLFTADHKLSVGDTGWAGAEYIMERLYGDTPVTSFQNEDGSLLFEKATIEILLGAKVGNSLNDTVVTVPSYIVTAIPELSQFTVVVALCAGCFVATVRRRK